MKLRQSIFSLTAAFALLCILQGCSSDDEPKRRAMHFATATEETHTEGTSVTVHSEATHQSGQKHRSSNNFSTSSLKDKSGNEPTYMLVSCPEGVTFDINIDQHGTDPVWNNDVYNGAILPYHSEEKFYISNPAGAGSSFDVTITAIFPCNDNVFVSSPGRHLEGQSHRSGLNFVLPSKYARFRVRCSNPDVSFGIEEDVTGSDNKIARKVKDGDIVNLSCSKHNYYIYETQGASKAFQVIFEPLTVEWMSQISDNTLISDLTIPGTHDTGTYALEAVNFGYSKCQNMNMTLQLEAGIRYFDLRVTGGMDLEHGGLPCNVSFDQIASATTEFLENHDGETVIFELSGGSDFVANFNKYLNDKPEIKKYFWMENYVPKLSEVRGRIIVLRRYAYDSKQGLDFNTNSPWPHDGVGQGKNVDNINYYIEDKYFTSLEHDTHEKRDLINEAFDYKLSHPGTLCITFTSISATLHTPYQYMWGGGTPAIDPVISDVLAERLKNLQSEENRIGIVVMDYFNRNGHDDTAHIVELLINQNFSDPAKKPFDINRIHSSYDAD